MNSVKVGGIEYILRRQANKRLLHHEKVGWPNTCSNLVIGGVGSGYMSGGVGSCLRQFWWELYLRAKVGKKHGSYARAW
jgi:hypothetical protein